MVTVDRVDYALQVTLTDTDFGKGRDLFNFVEAWNWVRCVVAWTC